MSVRRVKLGAMYETPAELTALQELLDRSISRSNPHLTSIIEPGRRTLTAERISAELPPVSVLNVASVTARGEPRLSAVDGHFRHGKWYFSTSGVASKAKHLLARPAVSVSYTPRDGYGIWAHGTVAFLEPGSAEWQEYDAFLTTVYGQSPTEWADEIVFLRVDPQWMVGFAMTEQEMTEFETELAAREGRLAAAEQLR